ncbi:MAG TPA: VWA domain-containing protein [Phototrophicaceae bacterium]|nr:VWA domain-containing protein [Phototrophicaceae bacterium]
MKFIWPEMLILLVLIPVLIWVYLRMQQRRTQRMARNTTFNMLRGATRPGARRHIPPAIFLLSLAIMIVALARPETVLSLPRIEGTVILAFDVSGSMAATDMTPTRIDAAKAAATDFVQHQPNGVQIGVVAFSDAGLSVQVPSDDQGPVLAAIGRLTPERGTSLASGITAALNVIATASTGGPNPNYYSNITPEPTPSPTPMPQGQYQSAIIVLLTDGENNEQPDPMQAAQAAADRGVRIDTVGIGSPTGTNVKINGFTLHTQLDEDTLKQIAQVTGGTYYNAQSAEELTAVYDNLGAQLVVRPQETEVTALLAGVSILVLLIGGGLSLVWFGRVP